MPQAGFVHYLPIATTLVSIAFLAAISARAMPRKWPPHLSWWAVGVFFYGLGTALESSVTLFGNSPELTRWWYWAGAILGGYPLATGTVYLLMKRTPAHVCTGLSLAVVIFASAAVFLSPLNTEALEPHRPSGAVIGWQWVRLLTPLINGYAALFLVGGAFYSSIKFAFPGLRISEGIGCPTCHYDLSGLHPRGSCPECGTVYNIDDLTETPKDQLVPAKRKGRRAAGTALIAFGGILPGVGGGMAKAGIVEALYIGELTGLLLIWWGYHLCVTDPTPKARDKTASENESSAQPATA